MEKKYRIRVTEGVLFRTDKFKTHVIETDYTGSGNSPGDCVTDAKNKAEAEWTAKFLDSWRKSREVNKKETAFSSACLEFKVVKRY